MLWTFGSVTVVIFSGGVVKQTAVFISKKKNLQFLHFRDTPTGMQDKRLDVSLAAQAVDGRTARVSACCTEHRQPLVLLLLCRLAQKVLKQVAEELQRHILESCVFC